MLTMKWITCFIVRSAAVQDCEACPFVVLFLDPSATHPHIADGVSTGIKYCVHPAASAVQLTILHHQLVTYMQSFTTMHFYRPDTTGAPTTDVVLSRRAALLTATAATFW
jgi:hypothetical protein